MKRTSILIGLACGLLFAAPTLAQVTLPAASPYATVSERVGLTDITIHYGRPGVNGRTIWGDLVPYGMAAPTPGFGNGKPMPWRAGANENTTITFADDVLVEGKPLAAGTYGLHMIPGETTWTVIFSENAASWGSFFYEEDEDALRVTVTPEAAPHQERLSYTFTGHEGTDRVTIALRWEQLMVPIRVQIADIHGVVMASLRNELRSRGGFSWTGYAQAAGYALRNQVNQEEALAWAEKAVSLNRNFNTLQVKAGLLGQLGRGGEEKATMAEAMDVASENQLNAYGYQLMGQGRVAEAVDVFKLNVERHPDSWNVYDSLGEGYANLGDAKNADKYYRLALSKLPAADQPNRDRINRILGDLGSDE